MPSSRNQLLLRKPLALQAVFIRETSPAPQRKKKKKKGKVSEHPVCDSEFLNKVLHALRQSGTKCKLLLERGDVSTLVSFPMLITSAREDGKSS